MPRNFLAVPPFPSTRIPTILFFPVSFQVLHFTPRSADRSFTVWRILVQFQPTGSILKKVPEAVFFGIRKRFALSPPSDTTCLSRWKFSEPLFFPGLPVPMLLLFICSHCSFSSAAWVIPLAAPAPFLGLHLTLLIHPFL